MEIGRKVPSMQLFTYDASGRCRVVTIATYIINFYMYVNVKVKGKRIYIAPLL